MARVSGSSLILSLLLTLSWPSHAPAAGESSAAAPAQDLLLREQVIGAGQFGVSSTAASGFAGFMNPTALAAEGNTLFVADQGLRRAFRVDLDRQEIAPVQPLSGAAPRVRIGLARSWFLLPNSGNLVREFGPDGELRGEYRSVEFTQAVDALREPVGGRIWVFDFTGTMHEFSAGGSLLRSRRVLADQGTTIEAATAGRHYVYVLDRSCACIIELDQHGLPMRTIADGELAFASDLAVDAYGRIWVSHRDRSRLVLIDTDESVRPVDLRALGLHQVSAVAIADDRLFAADPTSASVVVFRLLPPATERR